MKEFDFEKIPIVEIANEILLDGVKKGASDIHFDPGKDDLKIRMRGEASGSRGLTPTTLPGSPRADSNDDLDCRGVPEPPSGF